MPPRRPAEERVTNRHPGMAVLTRAAREHRRVLVPLGVAFAVNVLAYFLVTAPLARRVATVEDRNQRAAQALASARDTYGRASGTLTGRDRAVTELRTFYTDVLPADLTGARRLTHLRVAQMARQSNLRYASASFVPVEGRGSRLTQLKADVSLSGRYADVRRFVHQLETAPEFVVIDNVSLSESGEESGGLAVEMGLSTYYRSPQP
jgi:Tfp pilus assembly protein PilO